jgi:hypothetical protein
MRRWLRRLALVSALAALLAALGACLLIWSPDPISALGRAHAERGLDLYLDGMRQRGARGELSTVDRAVLHGGILVGTGVGGLFYPEGARILRHTVYGGGADLELDASYFAESEYLRRQIDDLGPGDHGPLWLKQSDDWRLSLAFNPYYLRIMEDRVRLYHPTMKFSAAAAKPVHTMVPIGRMRIKVYDNLVSALGADEFLCYAEWPRQ